LDERHEAKLVAEWLMALGHEQGLAWREMAVFYRTNALSRVMEDELRTKGIPYVIARGTAFYEREEVRNAIAYLRVIANPADDVSLLRIINTPSRGIGATSLKQLVARAQRQRRPLMEVLRDPESMEGVTPRTTAAIRRFTTMLDGWTASGTFMGRSVTTSLRRLTETAIRESGLEKMYADRAKKTEADADESRVENLNELITSTAQFEAEFDPDSDPVSFPGGEAIERGERAEVPPLLAMLRAYLEAVSLVADADRVDPEQGAVTLMTLHAAKGLEFPAVAIIGCEEGILPHSRSRESDEHLEEERRLCFVGMTRAMHRLLMTTARTRPFRGAIERQMESQFLRELDPEHIVVVDRAGDEFVSDLAPEVGGLSIGSVVRHPQFGLGRVEWLQSGRNARARIDFRGIGVKTLVLEYARLEVVEIFDD
ncbi:MAG: ATP-binding domain-containing protein, partial [Phycisphaerales bacterium]|nr:ATP-binding domain-containing protein [Phycisphaerales bacterium]